MEEEKEKYPYMSITINAEYGEIEEIKRVIKSRDLCAFIYNFGEYLSREKRKIEDVDSFDEKKYEFFEEVQKEFYQQLEENYINMDELWS